MRTTKGRPRKRGRCLTALEHLQRNNPGLTMEVAKARYPHGTYARYQIVGCRCIPCTEARRLTAARRAEERVAAAPWKIETRGRSTADGFKTIRVVNALTGAVDATYTLDLESSSSTIGLQRRAARRVAHLNGIDGDRTAAAELLVDAKLARQIIARLRAGGMGYKVIAARAMLNEGIIHRMTGAGRRPIRKVRQGVIDALAAIDPNALAGGARVPAAPSRLLLEQLVRNGWAKSYLASLIAGKKVAQIQIGARDAITVRNAARIAALYERLRDVRPMFRMTPYGPRPIGKAKKKPAGRASVAQTRELLAAIREAERRVIAGAAG